MDFQKAMELRNFYLHQKAVWEEVVEHLSQFLNKDSAPAKRGIATHGEGMVVPQDVIEYIVEDIGVTLKGIDNDLNQIHMSKVAEKDGEQKGKKRTKKKVKKGRAKKESS